MRTTKKDKMILANLLSDVIACHHLRLSPEEIEKTVQLLAVYCHVKPETIEGWEHLSFEPEQCCCMKHKNTEA